MDISIVGAGGVIGRQIAIALASARLLPATSRLQLVGRRGGSSERYLPGLAADRADAYGEELPAIDLAGDLDEILGDVIIIAAGETAREGGMLLRSDLASANEAVIDATAQAIARNGDGEELVLVLTNPVEAAVSWCCRHLPAHRVVGLGAYLDTMRFRQELALDLGVRRQAVQALALGEHGLGLVPCWSTVKVHGFAAASGQLRLRALAERDEPAAKDAIALVHRVLSEQGSAAAFHLVDGWGPGLRTIVRPFVTQMCGARTPVSTAATVVRLLRTLLEGGRVMAAAQVRLDGEFLDLHGVTGAPVVLSLEGIEHAVPYDLSPKERDAIRAGLWSGT
jgi:malate dehydrogenase